MENNNIEKTVEAVPSETGKFYEVTKVKKDAESELKAFDTKKADKQAEIDECQSKIEVANTTLENLKKDLARLNTESTEIEQAKEAKRIELEAKGVVVPEKLAEEVEK
jgi:peptidoglycan hydrolase CwlO-like protein